jgi:murein L,D-transpeptidase YafK
MALLALFVALGFRPGQANALNATQNTNISATQISNISPQISDQQTIPDALIDPGEKEGYILVVFKAIQQLHIYRHDGRGRIWLDKILPCSTGMVQGDKLIRGDQKTPEGYYIFRQKLLPSELPDIYGILAYPIDYPNFYDRVIGRGGDGIWTHGINKPLVDFDSRGCIELLNHDIAALEEFIKLYDTPIVVYDEGQYLPISELKQQSTDIHNFVESWRQAWTNKDHSSYAAKYSKDFVNSDGLSYQGWMDRKKRVAQSYQKIEVTLKNLKIFRHRDTLVVSFDQIYKGDNRFSSVGLKRLYLADSGDGQYEILAEEFSSLPGPQPNKWLTAQERNLALTTPPLAVAQVTAPAAVASAGVLLPPETLVAENRPVINEDNAALAAAEETARAALENRLNASNQTLAALATQTTQDGQTSDAAPVLPPKASQNLATDTTETAGAQENTRAMAKAPQPENTKAQATEAPPESTQAQPTNAPSESTQAQATEAATSTETDKPTLVASDQTPEAVKAPEAKQPLDARQAIILVDGWLKAWNARDPDSYFQYYSQDFYYPDQKLYLLAFKRYRSRLMRQASFINVKADDIEVTVQNNQAQVTFVQVYESDSVSDRGQKTLKLAVQQDQWKIISETFNPLP